MSERVTWIKGTVEVPPITDEVLEERLKQFTPLILRDGKLWTFDPVDPRRIAFTWSPTLHPEPTEGFQAIRKVRTQHGCGYHALFKPSLAEVLAQLPEDLEGANAFYIVTDTYATGDLAAPGDDEIQLFNDGSGHIATTVFGRIG